MIFKLEQWQVEVESTERKVKRLKSELFFWYFRFRNRKWSVKGRKCAWRRNEPNDCFQTPFEDWKPLIEDGKVIFRVCKCGNVDEQMRKMEEIDRKRS